MLAPFWIPSHVYVVATHDGVIFLDLKADQYLSLPLGQARLLTSVVKDWPSATYLVTESITTAKHDDPEQLARLLVDRGLLTQDPSQEKSACFTPLRKNPTLLSLDVDEDDLPRVSFRDIWHFVAASISATLQLRFRSLDSIVSRVAARKRRAMNRRVEFDAKSAAQHIEAFRRMRPYAFTVNGHCMFHTLVLLNFLARYDCFPTWVLGVKSSPFAAHSWVEQDSLVLDSTPEEVCFFTPILTV